MPTLNYHRCHGKECRGNHTEKTFTSQSEERKKTWKNCACPIVASGTLGVVGKRKARRMATKETTWDAAAAKMAPYIEANSWEPPPPPKPLPPLTLPPSPGKLSLPEAPADEIMPPEKAKDVPLDVAIRFFLAAHKDEKSAGATITQHRRCTAKILDLAKHLGVTRVDQWTRDMTRLLMKQDAVAPETAKTYLGRYAAFFNWCIKRLWIEENPAKLPSGIKNRAKRMLGKNQKFAFTNEEVEWMFEACKAYGSVQSFTRVWTGEDIADFIAVLLYTGLRIIDVATFHIDRLQGKDEIHVRTVKGGSMVYTVVPEWLADRIRYRAQVVGPYIFGEHTSEICSVKTCEWRKRLNKLWAQKETPWTHKPTPHRFRHTFARVLLQNGTSPADVAQLMGNTEAVVREYYAAWVVERQEETSKRLRRAFTGVPVPFTKAPAKVLQFG